MPPKQIDSLEFARTRSSLQSELPVAAMERLADVLADRSGSLAVRLVGSREADGRSWLHLTVAGELVLICQRCLGSVQYPVAIDSRLLLLKPGQPWPEDEETDLEDDGSDAIEADAALDVAALVEEEVLLALPIVPKHEKCSPPVELADDDEEVSEKPSPFAALASLKKH